MTLVASANPVEQLSGSGKELLRTHINSIRKLAENINSYELVANDLPGFSAGSHIDVHLPGGLIRQYSLCNDPRENHRYVIAVLREESGRGGSEYIDENFSVGDEVLISRPRNHFPLITDQGRLHFVAGGIGITPIMAMISECLHKNIAFDLHYCVRTRDRAAFLDQIEPLAGSGLAHIHIDNAGDKPNFREIFKHAGAGEHIYYCGPPGFMDHLALMTTHWPKDAVHLERFSAGTSQDAKFPEHQNAAFEVQVQSTGKRYTVQADETIVDVLKKHGIQVDVSCEEGYCGTCMTRYLDGHPEHRDTVLDEANQRRYVMICCARAKDGPLVLDI